MGTEVATRPAAEERRRALRYVPAVNHAYLAWWEGGGLRAEPGWLQNISTGGAALDVEVDPGAGAPAWLCVVCPGRTAWVSVRLLQRHGRVVRLEFTERFPYEAFLAIVGGTPNAGPCSVAHPVARAESVAPDQARPCGRIPDRLQPTGSAPFDRARV